MAEITEDNMGKEKYRWEESRCRICGAYHNNKTYTAKEMMYGTKEEFDYFICGNCGCMQIRKIPEDMGRYYKDNYYSMAERQVKFEGDAIYTKDRILDVGCGTGIYLLELAEQGYGNLYGCDPFIEKDIHYGDRIYIKKGELNQMEGEFDCIRMNNSFEHIGTPLETMECVSRMLKKSGVCHGLCESAIPTTQNGQKFIPAPGSYFSASGFQRARWRAAAFASAGLSVHGCQNTGCPSESGKYCCFTKWPGKLWG